MIVRHNWCFLGAEYACARRTPLDADAECFGCGATAKLSELIREEDRTDAGFGVPLDIMQTLDLIWHRDLRPLAELCCMVEEADGQA